MLKCRFRVSVFRLLTGYSGLVSPRKIALPITWQILFAHITYEVILCKSGCSIQTKRFGSLERSLHTSTDDDDFAELGLPVERVGGVIQKLKTGKPEYFLNTNGAKQKLNGSPFKTDSRLNIKDASCKVGKSSVPSPDLQNDNDERFFGKVSKASKRSVPNGFDCCDIEFKKAKAREKALSMGHITVKEVSLRIWPLQSSETVIIRITNIGLETTESAIHFTCKSCGLLQGLVRMKEDVVDASFSVNCRTDTETILKKLNSIVEDDSKWSAHLQHIESPSLPMTENGNARDDWALKIGYLVDLEREITVKKICVQDLEHLYRCMLHLENRPPKADDSFRPSK
ncbi:hypothetical protein F3Y22_tig00110794pilonHSYRG00133 [Hibiscus syriacus]|uniref:Uncharacterized protein n=1 Tax=Hibiscus syriacus TaxID=106335 RepID=A0A6A2ZPP5_HIBSY|nr:hypothetical protein F3Y22_tig00110794pilonHSYRG00133 [Hibiscus syriacus]